MKDEALKKLTSLIEVDKLKKRDVEEVFGMPLNSLSGILSGSKALPDKYVDLILSYQLNHPAPTQAVAPLPVIQLKEAPIEEADKKVKRISDADFIAEWVKRLKEFAGIIQNNPEPSSVKAKLMKLSEDVSNSVRLTPRQREGIFARCKNYLSGNYGKDALKDAYIHGHK